MRYLKDAKPLLIPLVSIIVAAVILWALGLQEASDAVIWLGTPLCLLLIVLWVIVFDPMKRWPESNWRQRLVKLYTFQR